LPETPAAIDGSRIQAVQRNGAEMTDIVERLRRGDCECYCEEAADLIERLRATLERIAGDGKPIPYRYLRSATPAEIARTALKEST
jgi:hypothetical protein